MKKVLVLSLALFLSACACMNGSDEDEVIYETRRTTNYVQQRGQNCDFYENGTCYHYVYDTSYAPSSYRRYEPNRYSTGTREVREKQLFNGSSCSSSRTTYSNSSPCGKPVVREKREPVEVVYKKIRYTTVYEPKTYEEVSYEKEPYNGYKREGCNDCL